MAAPYQLVLIRHGESEWNLQNRFTGWTDVGLTGRGRQQARRAGNILAARGYSFDVVHTSLLSRAIRTADLLLARMGLAWLPVVKHWRLNERHYGALQVRQQMDGLTGWLLSHLAVCLSGAAVSSSCLAAGMHGAVQAGDGLLRLLSAVVWQSVQLPGRASN
jgi:hypothetical protein